MRTQSGLTSSRKSPQMADSVSEPAAIQATTPIDSMLKYDDPYFKEYMKSVKPGFNNQTYGQPHFEIVKKDTPIPTKLGNYELMGGIIVKGRMLEKPAGYVYSNDSRSPYSERVVWKLGNGGFPKEPKDGGYFLPIADVEDPTWGNIFIGFECKPVFLVG